jgi:hypothetical protein
MSPFPAFAGNYTYNLSQNNTTNGGGTWNTILSMTATITQNQTISATLSKQDKSAFSGGYVYLQKDLYEASSALNLSSDYITAGQYSVTVISYSSLENIEANWIDDEMKIYMRFESISGGYAWVGPIGIERQLIIGDINVTIEPDEVKPSAMWRAELKPNTWSLWFESGKTVSGFKPGETIIQFKAISGWETPLDQTIRVNGGDLVQTTGMYKKTLPMPPSDIVATKGKYSKKVHLTWNYVDNAYAYEIWRSTTNSVHSAQKIQLVNTNYFDDTTVLSEIYYYWVKAVNPTGTSDFSAYDQGWPELLINLSPTHADFGPEDGNQYVQLTIPDNCQWSINKSLRWLSVESNIFGTGNEQIEYSVAPITQDGYRTGSLNVFVQCENFMNQNLTYTITQYK